MTAMKEALAVVAALVVGGVVGAFLKPSEDQLRPLEPAVSAGGDSHDAHGHHGAHDDHGHHH